MSRMSKAPDPSALLAFATGAGESLSEMRAKAEKPGAPPEPRPVPDGPASDAGASQGGGEGDGAGSDDDSRTRAAGSGAPRPSRERSGRGRSKKASPSTDRSAKGRSARSQAAASAALDGGKIPKIPKNFRIRQDLAERIEAIVAVSEMTQTDLLESALSAFLDEMEARYEERTGQKVPRATVVRLLD